MSDNWIIIIPGDPHFIPTLPAREAGIEFMRDITEYADEVTAEVTKEVRFIDCGANLERIICPNCGQEIEIEWWQDEMDRQNDEGFTLAPLQLPCCGTRKSLAELNYDWPQGYARFSIEALNPNIADLSEEQVRHFETLLGCSVIKVLQHL